MDEREARWPGEHPRLIASAGVVLVLFVLGAFLGRDLFARFLATTPPARPVASGVRNSPSPSGPVVPTSLRMIDEMVGWAIAEQAGRVPHAVRTTDGGMDWTVVLADQDAFATAGDFHDATHAWVIEVLGGFATGSRETVVIASTTNAGKTWTRTPGLTVDGDAHHVQFVDFLHGWIFATPSAGGAVGGGDTTLYRTVDGGLSWQAMKAASEVRPGSTAGGIEVLGTLPERCPMGAPTSAPAFIDEQTGWLGMSFCGSDQLFVTHDGGVHWTRQPLPAFPGPASPAGRAPYDQFCVDSPLVLSTGELVTFVRRGVTTGANALQDAAIYTSHDGGQTWTARRLPAAKLEAAFIDPSHGWMTAAGGDGDIENVWLFATSDGGQTWRKVSGPQPYFLGELDFVSVRQGYLFGPIGASYRTDDGGATWRAFAPG